MKFKELAAKVLEDCFRDYGLEFSLNEEAVFSNSARFYYDDSIQRLWQITFEMVNENVEWTLQEKILEDWYKSCSGEMTKDGEFL